MKEAQGIFTFKDGSQYLGEWKNDLKEGKGTFTWSDGNKFSGDWAQGESQKGILMTPDGQRKNIN